jgi:hypothetical protein
MINFIILLAIYNHFIVIKYFILNLNLLIVLVFMVQLHNKMINFEVNYHEVSNLSDQIINNLVFKSFYYHFIIKVMIN